MKKFIWISFIIVMTVMFSSMAMAKPKQNPIVISGDVIHACYQKINGQLRVVSDPSQCRPSEFPISLSAAPQSKMVFITSQTYEGDKIGGISGADGADSQCNTLATAAGLAGTYKAWLSDDTTGLGPAATFTHNMGPYVNIKGDTIANDWVGLTSGVLLSHIRYDETGTDLTPQSGGIAVWTGTDPLGQPITGQTCNGWTSGGPETNGEEGDATTTTFTWTASTTVACTGTAHLYCFEQ